MNPADPLSQLRDIHLPEPVGWWPPAPGWWLLAGLVLTAILVAGWLSWRRWRRRAYRRAAMAELAADLARFQQDGDARRYLASVNGVLKRTALVAYPVPEVAGLSGERWCQFLDAGLPGRQPCFTGSALQLGPYAGQPALDDPERLHDAACSWVKSHRVAV